MIKSNHTWWSNHTRTRNMKHPSCHENCGILCHFLHPKKWCPDAESEIREILWHRYHQTRADTQIQCQITYYFPYSLSFRMYNRSWVVMNWHNRFHGLRTRLFEQWALARISAFRIDFRISKNAVMVMTQKVERCHLDTMNSSTTCCARNPFSPLNQKAIPNRLHILYQIFISIIIWRLSQSDETVMSIKFKLRPNLQCSKNVVQVQISTQLLIRIDTMFRTKGIDFRPRVE